MAMVVKRFDVYLINADPTRISCEFGKKQGRIILDQIRTTDKSRLIKKLANIDLDTQLEVIATLQRLFAF